MTCSEKALEYYSRGYNCAQAVLAGCGQITGLDEKTALMISGGFGGGMRIGSVCGAATGGLMALGCRFPFADSGKPQDKERIGKITVEFLNRFKKENLCLDCDGITAGNKENARDTVCAKAVASAARIAAEMAAE